MNARKSIPSAKGGFMLVTVLIITAVGLLFGAGALLLFRFQCQQRIDRQHELEKVYAVRSTLNYIRECDANKILEEGKKFSYYTGSDRNLQLLVKPVSPYFPDMNKTDRKHFVMENKHLQISCGNIPCACAQHYNETYDYEYGEDGATNRVMNYVNVDNDGLGGLAFRDLAATNGVRWWVNIGMRDTGGWLQDDYGRRYSFYPKNYVGGTETKDVIRLCLIRDVTNRFNKVGRQHGWPLSNQERALVFEIRPLYGDIIKTNNAVMTLFEYRHTGMQTVPTVLGSWSGCPAQQYTGVQIAGKKISVFHIRSDKSGGYTFMDSKEMSLETYNYFASGSETDDDGKIVKAPELRAVFEVEAVSNTRPNPPADNPLNQQLDFLTYFKVTPAYQYDVFLEHPVSMTNRATVAQKTFKQTGPAIRDVVFSILTYDTHGTDNKGFRKDERDWANKKNGGGN